MAAPLLFPAAPTPDELAAFPLNDLGNAMRLIRLVGGRFEDDGTVDPSQARLLYLRERGWIAFDGRIWDLRGGEERARRFAHAAAQGLVTQGEMAQQQHGLNAKAWADFVTKSGQAGATSAMLAQAASYLAVDLEVFDRDPMALACENGVLSFTRDKEGRPKVVFSRGHDPADRFTRMASARWDPKAEAPLLRDLLAFCQPDAAMQAYLQKVFGYAATGSTRNQVFVILQGKGGDGKSTLVNAVRETLGGYAVAADVAIFLDTGPRRAGEASPEIARLAGDTRLISVGEPPRGSKLASAAIKSFTGGSPVTARELRQGIFEFTPAGKVILECNGRPSIADTDDGIWRRTRIVLFEKQIPADQVDEDLPAKLRGERDGILRWLAEGVLAWMAEGLSSPPAMAAALEDYRRGSNPFAEWLNDELVRDEHAVVASSELYAAYKLWMEEQGHERPMTQTTFGRALGDQQIILAGRDNGGKKLRRGARLRTAAEKMARNADGLALAPAARRDDAPTGFAPEWPEPED